MKNSLKKRKVSRFYSRLSPLQKLGLGLIFLLGLLAITKTYDSTTYAFFSYARALSYTSSKATAIPTFITIPSVEITLPIDETSITYGFWGMSEDGVSHLASSPVPGGTGNTVIYGKNTDDKFGRLTSIRKGDEISVITQDGETHDYTVTDLYIVTPNESAVINNTTDERLTLYTPYGFGDLKRFVVVAKPITL